MTTPIELDQYGMDEMLAPPPCNCPTVALQWAEPAGAGMVTIEGEEVPAPDGMTTAGWVLQVGTQRAALRGA